MSSLYCVNALDYYYIFWDLHSETVFSILKHSVPNVPIRWGVVVVHLLSENKQQKEGQQLTSG
jgi:hypothetical protein